MKTRGLDQLKVLREQLQRKQEAQAAQAAERAAQVLR